jgi:RimJ/RimL family protein N-acetyltransferase
MALEFIYGNETTPEINRFLSDYVGAHVFGRLNDFGPCGSLGICQDKTIIAGVIFHNWTPDYGVIEISMAAESPAWFSRRSCREILGICFNQHHCQQVVARVAVENDALIRILDFLKFTRLRLPNMRGKGKDEYLLMLTADEWRQNKLSRTKSNEQKNPASALATSH